MTVVMMTKLTSRCHHFSCRPSLADALANVDMRHFKSTQFRTSPDVLIMPSKLKQLGISKVLDTLVMNPGSLT